jgi:hypothetical protein
VLRVRADHVGAQVRHDGHRENRHDQLPRGEDPHQAHPESPNRQDRPGQVNRDEDDLECRPGAEEAGVEDVRAEELEEAVEGHPGPVLQLAQVRVGSDG